MAQGDVTQQQECQGPACQYKGHSSDMLGAGPVEEHGHLVPGTWTLSKRHI